MFLPPGQDRRDGARDLASDECLAPTRGLVIEENPAAGKNAIPIPIIICDPMSIGLGYCVRALRLEGCGLTLRRRCAPKQLAGRGLVKTHIAPRTPDGFQEA